LYALTRSGFAARHVAVTAARPTSAVRGEQSKHQRRGRPLPVCSKSDPQASHLRSIAPTIDFSRRLFLAFLSRIAGEGLFFTSQKTKVGYYAHEFDDLAVPSQSG